MNTRSTSVATKKNKNNNINHERRAVLNTAKITMANIPETIQEILKNYNALLGETENKLNSLMKDIAADKLIRGLSVQDLKDAIDRLTQVGDKIWTEYGKLYGKEAPDSVAQIEKDINKRLDSLKLQAQVVERFLSLQTDDQKAKQPLQEEQNSLLKDPNQDITKHRYFMSAYDVVHGQPGEFGMDIAMLSPAFAPDLLNALLSRKIEENRKKFKSKHSDVLSRINIGAEIIDAEYTEITEDAEAKEQEAATDTTSTGEKSVKKNEMSKEEPAIAAPVEEKKTEEKEENEEKKSAKADAQAKSEADIQKRVEMVSKFPRVGKDSRRETTQIRVKCSDDWREDDEDLSPEKEKTLKKIKTYLKKDISETVNEINELTEQLNAFSWETVDEEVYPEYTISIPKMNGSKLKKGYPVVRSFIQGNLKAYQMAFRQLGSLSLDLAVKSIGDTEEVTAQRMQRMMNSGILEKTESMTGTYYSMRDDGALFPKGWSNSPVSNFGFKTDFVFPVIHKATGLVKNGPENRAANYNRMLKISYLEKLFDYYHLSPGAAMCDNEKDTLIDALEAHFSFYIMQRMEDHNLIIVNATKLSKNTITNMQQFMLRYALDVNEICFFMIYIGSHISIANTLEHFAKQCADRFGIALEGSITMQSDAEDPEGTAGELIETLKEVRKQFRDSVKSANDTAIENTEHAADEKTANVTGNDQTADGNTETTETKNEKVAEILDEDLQPQDVKPVKNNDTPAKPAKKESSKEKPTKETTPATKAVVVAKAKEKATAKEPAAENLPKAEKVGKTEESKEHKADAENQPESIVVQKEEKKTGKLFAQTGRKTTCKDLAVLAKQGRVYTIFPYLNALGEQNGALYKMLSYAFNEPGSNHEYSSESMTKLFAEGMEVEGASLLYLASALRVLCGASGNTDWGIGAIYDTAHGYSDAVSSPALNSLMYEMKEFKKKEPRGAWYFSDMASGSAKKEARIKEAQSNAQKYYNEYFENYIRADKSNPRYMFTVQIVFEKNAMLAQFLKYAKDDKRDLVEEIGAELAEHFIRNNSAVAPENIDPLKIDAYIDRMWDEAGDVMRHFQMGTKLYGSLRNNLISKIQRILETTAAWVVAVTAAAGTENANSVAYYHAHTKSWIRMVNDAKKELFVNLTDEAKCIGILAICSALNDCNDYFNGNSESPAKRKQYFYAGFLDDDSVMLTQDLLPDTTGKTRKLDGFSLKERVLAHVGSERKTNITADVKRHLYKIMEAAESADLNYGSAEQICDYLEAMNGEDLAKTKQDIQTMKNAQNLRIELDAFLEDLELAQGYGTMDNTDGRKEQIITDVEAAYQSCDSSGNVGFFRALLHAYREQIIKDSEARKIAVTEMYQKIMDKKNGYEVSEKMKNKIEQMINDHNYTVAEDLIGRIQNGDVNDSALESGMEYDYLLDFDKNFSTYYRMDRLAQQNGTPELVQNWLKGGNRGTQTAGEEKIKTILSLLGFRDPSVRKLENKKEDSYEVRLAAPKNRRRDAYLHPVAVFGSEAEKMPFHVVCLYGNNYSAQEFLSAVRANGLTRHTIVFMTGKFPLPERHQIACRMHTEFAGKTILILDRPLMMYLASNCKASVINQAFMQVATPYAFYQPYIPSSSADIRIEMFNGRKRELEEIESPNGANIIYGGRQLGKSAILKMAAHEIDHNENGDRAVLVDINCSNVAQAATSVSSALVDRGILDAGCETEDWTELTRAIRTALDKDGAPEYFLLMMDEADGFIDDCKNHKYLPIARLKALQESSGGRFKFVIAGLRDVIRFTKGAAAGNNSVLPQLKSVTVKPFEYNEAKSLIEEPLWYLGFRFSEKTEPLVNMILANTNYFPGLIQLYCEKLVDALRDSSYAGYDRTKTPPYELSERHIKKVLADEDFRKEVREKYFITLRHADDNYYHILAYLMADLYMNEGTDGHSPARIWQLACEFGISKIATLDIGAVKALMDEMCELNVFRKAVGDSERYIFSRYNFYQMLGDTLEDIEDKIADYME